MYLLVDQNRGSQVWIVDYGAIDQIRTSLNWCDSYHKTLVNNYSKSFTYFMFIVQQSF